MNDPGALPTPVPGSHGGPPSWSSHCCSPGSSGPSAGRGGRPADPGRSRAGGVVPLARRVRRLAVPERAPGGRVRRGRGLRPVPPRDRRGLPHAPDGPIAGAGRRPPRTAADRRRRRDCRSRRRGCDTRSSAATAACSTRRRRRDADGACVRRDRGRGPLRPRLGDARHHLPDRARRLPLPVADRLVRPAGALGYLARLRGVRPRSRTSSAPIQPDCLFCHANQCPPRGRDVEPLRAADLPGPRHRLRALPRPGRAARRTGAGRRPSPT